MQRRLLASRRQDLELVVLVQDIQQEELLQDRHQALMSLGTRRPLVLQADSRRKYWQIFDQKRQHWQRMKI